VILSLKRIKAIIIHYFYITRYNLTLVVDIVFWPIIELMVWGFTIFYLKNIQNLPLNFITSFLTSALLWMIILRSQTAISIPFLNDMTSGNTSNLFISPLKDIELIIGMIMVSFIKLIATILVLSLLAFLLFSFNIFKLGFYLIPFFINLLIMGWSLGILANALLLRFSGKIVFITWFFSFSLQPLSCTYYACSALPPFLKALSTLVPASHIFEGMRMVIFEQTFNLNYIIYAAILNIIYLVASYKIFKFMSWWTRKSGALAATF
jgi:ABC-2 type transport system permease protein